MSSDKDLDEIYLSDEEKDEDIVYISDNIENSSFDKSNKSDENNESIYYYDTNDCVFKLKTHLDEKILEVKKQMKSIEQRIEESIQTNEYQIINIEDNSDDEINSNALIIDKNCCQIMDSIERSVSFNEFLDSKSKVLYNHLEEWFEMALNDLECEQIFLFEEWYLNLNYGFIDNVLNDSPFNQKNMESEDLSLALNKLINDLKSLGINDCFYLNEENKSLNRVSVKTDYWRKVF